MHVICGGARVHLTYDPQWMVHTTYTLCTLEDHNFVDPDPACDACAQVHLIYDLQLMMAGKRFQTSPDEYISSALSIFLDIVNIFLMILTLLGGTGCNN